MPISEDEEREERQLRIDQMTVNIEKMRADMATQQRQLTEQLAWETRKYVVSIIVAVAVAAGAGVAIGNYFTKQPLTPQTIIIQPGSIVAPPAVAQPK